MMAWRALSLTQPWATLVAIGAKRIETRSWSTPYRGPLLIHAARTYPVYARELAHTEPFVSALTAGGWPPGRDLPRGALLATARITECVRTATLGVWPESPERDFGDFGPGRWAWYLADVQPLAEPVPARGALGVWSVPASVTAPLAIAPAAERIARP